MAKIIGRKASIGIDDSAGACRALTGTFNTATLSHTAEAPDTTSFGDTTRTRLNDGIKDWEFSFAGFYDNAANLVDEVLAGIGPGGSTRMIFGPNGSTSGCTMYSASAVLTEYTVEYAVAGAGNVSGTLTARSGSLTRGTFG